MNLVLLLFFACTVRGLLYSTIFVPFSKWLGSNLWCLFSRGNSCVVWCRRGWISEFLCSQSVHLLIQSGKKISRTFGTRGHGIFLSWLWSISWEQYRRVIDEHLQNAGLYLKHSDHYPCTRFIGHDQNRYNRYQLPLILNINSNVVTCEHITKIKAR